MGLNNLLPFPGEKGEKGKKKKGGTEIKRARGPRRFLEPSNSVKGKKKKKKKKKRGKGKERGAEDIRKGRRGKGGGGKKSEIPGCCLAKPGAVVIWCKKGEKKEKGEEEDTRSE